MGEQRTALILLLILCFAVVSISEIGTVKAESTIYIRADGSVERTYKIQRSGNVYSFTDNIYASIIIERENAVIDGTGYLLQGNNSEYGIKLESGGVTIKNMKIRNKRKLPRHLCKRN